ncbi:L-cysteine desulfidase family protein [Alkaliphilus oremlandii]|uniref:UPF0597 protein Clos_2050 n=1 Tax=Alkaliphilus oremlandii (strain OhILAs) TaxID=350688 RepID=Y2050_ALKOO|nr:L-serine ammonia-lyase, iron-sulfur-dependent, subunit alpha [Alkaliphilus oremlandii]A8MIF4.1 RecName: Full=UPF0597 protein Clos_2050 [Alkaliphilus oremlandii OhILAs]ABW19586.1 protein of unknown function DUF1063 [Alkaliphilus oremlandii OhILAs]
MELKNLIIKTLKEEVVPAMGCTEPVAVALGCAKAKELLGDMDITKAEILVSPNIYKNGLSVGIPNTNEVGLFIAGALGIVAGKSEKDLQVLSGIVEEDVVIAHELLKEEKVTIDIKPTIEKIYVEVNLYAEEGSSTAIIQGRHNEFVYLAQSGNILLNGLQEATSSTKSTNPLFEMKIRDIIKEISELGMDEIGFMLEGLEMNEKIAMEGLKNTSGISVGRTIYENIQKGILADDLMNTAMMLTAAGSDARMSGIRMPVMSSSGSGNNGLTAILPILAYHKKFPVEDRPLAQALAISHMTNSYIKHYIGRLSALCGCGVAAGTGASISIAWLMGADAEKIDGTIKNMIGNLSGMICDGAKVGCALKLATSASAAIQSALLALNGHVIPSKNGIIGDTAEDTIKNLGILSEEGMYFADHTILKVMKAMEGV